MRKLEGVVKEIVDEMNYLKKREERFSSTNGASLSLRPRRRRVCGRDLFEISSGFSARRLRRVFRRRVPDKPRSEPEDFPMLTERLADTRVAQQSPCT